MTNKEKKIISNWLYQILVLEKSKFMWLIFWSLALSVANGAVILILGPVMRTFFSEVSANDEIQLAKLVPEWKNILPDYELSLSYSAIIFLVPLSLAVLGLLRSLVLNRFLIAQDSFALSFTNEYRTKLFSTILGLPYQEIIKKSSSEWMSYLINDTQFLQTRVSELLKVSIKETTMILGIIVGLIIIDYKITLIIVILALPLTFYGFKLGRKISKFTQLAQSALAELSGIIGHLRKSYWYFRSQNAEEAELSGFQKFNDKYYGAIRRSIFARAVLTPGLEFIGTFALCSVLVYFQFFSKTPQPDYMFQIILSLGLILRPLRALGDQLAKLGELKGALKHSFAAIIELNEQREQNSEKQPTASNLQSPTFPIKIGKISLAIDDKTIFDFESLMINAGDCIAVVGPSGSGKSSFLKVLAGLYQPTFLEASLTSKELNTQTSYVSQRPFFFNGTVKENLTYQLTAPPKEKDEKNILSSLMIHNPESILSSKINSAEKEISHGQLQRLTIARGLLRKKSIFLFDEASSALDRKTEETVIKYIKSFTRDNSVASIWITHRLELLDQFDKVWQVENGSLKVN